MGCCLGRMNNHDAEDDPKQPLHDEGLDLHERFRQSRNKPSRSRGCVASSLKFALCTMGLWRPHGCLICLCFLIMFVCWAQLLYDLYVVIRCRYFDCGFVQNTTNHQHHKAKTTRVAENTTFTLASLGGSISYTLLIVSLCLMNRNRRNALKPSEAFKDLGRWHWILLCCVFIFLSTIFLSSVFLFYWITRDQPNNEFYYLMVAGVGTQFIAQWASIVGCFAFALSSFGLGTFAEDTLRRLKQMRGDTDAAICIHEEMCSIVTDTVEAFCPWFIGHWLLYGLTVIFSIIYCSDEIKNEEEVTKLLNFVYFGLFMVNHLAVFMFPCCCAEYITSSCGGLYARLNKTTRAFWAENHTFKDRGNLHQFTTYAKDRQCVFKIGRITFTSTLAWFSLFFGSTGVLYHFF